MARKHSAASIKALKNCLDCTDRRAQIAAAVALLDRGYGRPSQTTELTGPAGGPILGGSLSDLIHSIRHRNATLLAAPPPLSNLTLPAPAVAVAPSIAVPVECTIKQTEKAFAGTQASSPEIDNTLHSTALRDGQAEVATAGGNGEPVSGLGRFIPTDPPRGSDRPMVVRSILTADQTA